MPQTVKLALSTLLGMLGWHGVFLLFLIVSFKLFLAEQDSTVCPCTWNVTYSILMFVIPSLASYVIAVFGYFRQDDDSVPWKALRRLYVFKAACQLYDERTHWDFHAEHCISCKQLNRDWSLVKIGVSVIFSLLYPAVWLSLSFLQAYYYVCANVGPTRSSLITYCDVQIEDVPEDYDKEYGLAVIRSKVIGGVLFISALFCLSVFVIIYGEIEHFLKKVDFCPSDRSHLQVDISILPRRSSGTIELVGSQGNQVPAVLRVREVHDARRQQAVDDNKAICVNFSDAFVAALRDNLQDGAWQGIDIHCSQQEEHRNLHGACATFHSPSHLRSQQQTRREYTYESLTNNISLFPSDSNEDLSERTSP